VLFNVLCVSIVLFYVLFVFKCVLNYCRQVSTELQLNISYSVLALGTQVRGFKPGQSRRIFKGEKSSARLPSEGK